MESISLSQAELGLGHALRGLLSGYCPFKGGPSHNGLDEAADFQGVEEGGLKSTGSLSLAR